MANRTKLHNTITNALGDEFMNFVDRYTDKPWQWGGISSNPNITMEMIERHPDKSWNWVNISQNKNITIEIIERHPDKPWDWGGVVLQ
jgi:hypothetical protein